MLTQDINSYIMWLNAKRISGLEDVKLVEPKRKTIQGIEIAYRDMGKGLPVFCFPAWPSSSLAYLPLSFALEEHVRLIAMDMPGWGGESGAMTKPPTIENYASLAKDFVKSFDLDEYAFIGYSFGGLIAQIIMSTSKLSPKKMIYVSSVHSGDDIYKKEWFWLEAYKVAKRLGLTEKASKAILRWILANFVKRTDYYERYKDSFAFHYYIQDTYQLNMESIMGTLYSVINKEYIDVYKLGTESIVIYADGDAPYIKKESREIAQVLGLEPIVLENTDHNHLGFDVNKSADIIGFMRNAEALAGSTEVEVLKRAPSSPVHCL